MSTTFRKRFSSSILLWVRADQPRKTGMNYWKGPHSKIISASPGLDEYRQTHLAETNPGLWPATPGLETAIPAGRKIDGVAQVTFQSMLSAFAGGRTEQAGVQGRNQCLPTHPALSRLAQLGALV